MPAPTERKPDPPGKRAPSVGRRKAIQLFGAAAVAAAAPLPLLGRGLATARSTPAPVRPDPHGPAQGHGGDPADRRLRRWTMVIDLRYCDGCQSVGLPPQCTTACVVGHLAPEPMEWIEVFEAPAVPGKPSAGTYFQPVPCQQCQNPPCTNVCPVGATFSTPEGTVLIDQDRCIGCRICMAACPYDRRFFNWGQPSVPAEASLAHYSAEQQMPARKGTVMKCDFCPEMARAGELPFCAQACPNNAIYYGDLEEGIVSNGVEVKDVYRFLVENHATRLKEDLGTEPRVHYIPGHGELVGRDPRRAGRRPVQWNWQKKPGSVRWRR